MATVTTRSLRVRETPSEAAEVVAGVREGEVYPVVGISSDGLWVEIEVERAPSGRGWVGAGFVSVNGDVTGVEIFESENADDTGMTTGMTADGAADSTASATPEPAEEAVDSETEAAPLPTPDVGFAVVSAETPLRVRSEPTTEFDNKIGNVFYGEVYPVVEVSEDGAWVRIDVPELDAENGGWVAAEFLVIGGQ
ncbi:MAG: SH3 domain-containing protein [Caldilineaceae bacterium]|nr:SH3 domain-containing protein [Caldilineaceae bacterium]